LGYVYGALQVLDQTRGYPFIAAGLISWFFVSGCIGGGPTVFVNAAGLLKERALPVSHCVYQYTLRMFIEFLARLTVFIPVALLSRFFPGASLIFLIPAFALYFINGLWVNMLLGTLGARYRDIGQIIGPLMMIAFLASPILWPPEMLQGSKYFALLNPITHFVEIVRHPLLGTPPPMISLVAVVAMAIVGWLCTIGLFGLKKNNIVFWL
jgi:ABC-type polysaccharide/polyol phosphate export permease